MRRVIFQMMLSLDGYYEGPNRQIDWHTVDEEFNDIAINFLNHVDILLFGRATYELMASYWPTAAATTDDPIVAEKMNTLSKIVVSQTMRKAEWNNTLLLDGNFRDELVKLKQQPGKDIAIFGSSDLALTLMDMDYIDEFRFFVSPVILGAGKPLFKGMRRRLHLKLTGTTQFRSGNVLLCYEPNRV
jgi:dihydrofolate reductase